MRMCRVIPTLKQMRQTQSKINLWRQIIKLSCYKRTFFIQRIEEVTFQNICIIILSSQANIH